MRWTILRMLKLTWTAAVAQALRMIQMNLTVTSVKVLTSSVVIVNIIRPKLFEFDTSKNFQTRSLSRLIMVNKNWYYLPQWVRLSLL